MEKSPHSVRLGTRASALARWQTDYVANLLKNAWPNLEIQTQIITTQGDRVVDKPLPLIGGKGVFTAELEAALHQGQIDFAVHSLKDLPTQNPPGLVIGAVPLRADPADVLISRKNHKLETLPKGAAVGTSSRRRAAQLLYHRPDLRMIDIRGNIDTRLRKALASDSEYDAIILAFAGLERLGRTDVITEKLALDVMLPAPGQGALAVQSRDEASSLALLAPLNHSLTEIAVTAERAFLSGLGSGCSVPVAAYAQIENDVLKLRGRVIAPDGSQQIDVTLQVSATLTAACEVGLELAKIALQNGGARLLEMQNA